MAISKDKYKQIVQYWTAEFENMLISWAIFLNSKYASATWSTFCGDTSQFNVIFQLCLFICSTEGIQLLCLIDKGMDACRYLQTYGQWNQAVWLAKVGHTMPRKVWNLRSQKQIAFCIFVFKKLSIMRPISIFEWKTFENLWKIQIFWRKYWPKFLGSFAFIQPWSALSKLLFVSDVIQFMVMSYTQWCQCVFLFKTSRY